MLFNELTDNDFCFFIYFISLNINLLIANNQILIYLFSIFYSIIQLMKEDFFTFSSFIINDSTIIKFFAIKSAVPPIVITLEKSNKHDIYPILNANNL